MIVRSNDIAGIYFATRHIVIADAVFTAPSVVIQLITGIALLKLGGYNLEDKWILFGLALYIFAGACWLPVVWM